ncbi:MAG: hypothetical protein F6K26_33995 [Moorea sp. SIO2I5]|nr:hypothetical protein [Moorena sp. SIO2I5]
MVSIEGFVSIPVENDAGAIGAALEDIPVIEYPDVNNDPCTAEFSAPLKPISLRALKLVKPEAFLDLTSVTCFKIVGEFYAYMFKKFYP